MGVALTQPEIMQWLCKVRVGGCVRAGEGARKHCNMVTAPTPLRAPCKRTPTIPPHPTSRGGALVDPLKSLS